MKPFDALKRGLREVEKDLDLERFSTALTRVEDLIADFPAATQLHVLRGRLIQLEEEPRLDLNAAKEAFARAIELDAQSLEAWLEKANFEFSVEDDAKAAAVSFAKAEAIARTALVDALVGRAAALQETGHGAEAFHCLTTARFLQSLALPRLKGEHPADSVLEQFESLLSSR